MAEKRNGRSARLARPKSEVAAERAERQRATFLKALSDGASVQAAAAAAGVTRRTPYNWRESVEGFGDAWDEAEEAGTDALEDEAVRRARDGTEKPVFQNGREVGRVREYSDTLLIFLLKGRRPGKFRDRQSIEHTGKDGGPIKTEDVSAVDILAGRITRLAERNGPQGGSGGSDGGAGR
jgi:hypothetical protein